MSDLALDVSTAKAEAKPRSVRPVAIWLWSLAALVFLMVVVGGATRLTESGLSITEWKPVTGVIPPLSQADWAAEFAKYKQIPQFSALFPDMDLGGFKFIYFWEWSHRLIGRLLGFTLLIPFIGFWAAGRLSNALKLKLLGIFALGGLQGFVGWWMVSSGLSERVEVTQERLAIHLLLASFTFACLVWLAASVTRAAPANTSPGLRRFGSLIVFVVFVQIGLGALVAGLRAGRVYNTWPLMDGAFIPPRDVLTSLTPLWRNLTDNVALVQLDHRLVAYTLLALVAIQAVAVARYGGKLALRGFTLFALVVVQAALGIATLLLAVPLWAGLLHQAFAMLVLGKAVVYRQALSPDHAANSA
ncbi:COX15/CtaA family protein [Methyloferula stellata]|uniref:COX15/CtaA family protein n=1 Tax=Methyloferula stellata TaxID=876270 RepID=UPI00037CC694|nr:COX15/CtaA family protein [Methyloferula stellata]